MITHTFTTTWQQALGVRLIEDEAAHEVVEDWSKVRSPSRAARRRRQGHRQNIEFRKKPIAVTHGGGRTIVAHPLIVAEIRRQVSARLESSIERQMKGGLG